MFLSGVIIAGEPFPVSEWVLSTVLLTCFLFVIAMAIGLQFARGSSQRETEQYLLEQDAREADLKLSLDEMIGSTDTVRMSELQKRAESSLQKAGETGGETGSSARMKCVVTIPPGLEKSSALDMVAHLKQSFGMAKNDGFNTTLYPCFVVEHTTLASFDRLPFHEDALSQNLMDELRPDTREPAPSHTFFISQARVVLSSRTSTSLSSLPCGVSRGVV